jgi:hypothetical protein
VVAVSLLFTQICLHQILAKFGLAQLAVQTNAYIRVFTGFECYRFHPEEIFLFIMMKCKTGYSDCKMFDLIFGGHYLRRSFWISMDP